MNQPANKPSLSDSVSTSAGQCHDEFRAGTLVRKLIIYRKSLAIKEEYIALIRPVTPKKRKKYYKDSNVPLKDFSSLFKGIAGQFTGKLSSIKDSKLKKLSLPVMNPSGIGMPEMPDESATKLVVVTSGQWNGVLFCTDVAEEPVALANFEKAKNGDILGPATLKNGEELSLLNLESIIKREGFLSMV
jgi:hypothetical protein